MTELDIAMNDEVLPEFRGKAVTFYLINMAIEYAVTLSSPEFERQAGRWFVVGEAVPSASKDWTEGLRTAIAWDQVAQYYLFESPSDFQTRIGAKLGRLVRAIGQKLVGSRLSSRLDLLEETLALFREIFRGECLAHTLLATSGKQQPFFRIQQQ